MNYFSVKLGLDASGLQNDLISKLKNMNADVIQVSDGLVVRTSEGTAAMEQLIKSIAPSLNAEPLNTKEVAEDSKTPKDVLAFIGER